MMDYKEKQRDLEQRAKKARCHPFWVSKREGYPSQTYDPEKKVELAWAATEARREAKNE